MLHRAHAAAWLGLAISPRTDLHSVHVEIKPTLNSQSMCSGKRITFFLQHNLFNGLTFGRGVFRYINAS